MTPANRLPVEEASRRARDIYERLIEPTVRPEDVTRMTAVEIYSGDYEFLTDAAAYERLRARHPEGHIYCLLTGSHPHGVDRI